MSEYGDLVQNKCLDFSDRIIKLNDYLLKEAANAKPSLKYCTTIHPQKPHTPYLNTPRYLLTNRGV